MTVIVESRGTSERYVLIGAGFGAFKATKPHWFLGNLVTDEKSGEVAVVAICDAEGRIRWVRSDELRVVSVDGNSPGVVLSAGS